MEPTPSSFAGIADETHLPTHSAYDLLNSSRALQPVCRTIVRAAASNVSVLIIGESGTGKELVARAIHEQSDRSRMPFVCLNLAAVPLELAETVLFGHAKGAFTGATHASLGYCRSASHGTLFLDEIGEADLSLQVKLLRFLQNGEIQPVGAESTITVDVRIVAATNRELDLAVREKRFREDLFYRLNVIQVALPALRDRPNDIDPLIDRFLVEFNSKYARRCEFSPPLRECFFNAQWPGNIRQLRSLVESLIILSEHDLLGLQDLSSEFLAQIGTHLATPSDSPVVTKDQELDRLTRHLIESVLEQSKGHVAMAAKRLGISKSTLYRWIKRHAPL